MSAPPRSTASTMLTVERDGADPADPRSLPPDLASAASRRIWSSCARSSTTPRPRDNDRFVALDLLKNANIAAGMVLPMCQDTGTAIVIGKKGQQVWTGGGDDEALCAGRGRGLYRAQSALFAGVAAHDVRGGQYRQQSAGADRPLRRPRATPTIPCSSPRAAARPTRPSCYQQTKALLNPSAREIPRCADQDARHLGLPALSPGDRHRRHLGRDDAEDGEAGLDQISRRSAHHGRQARPRLPRSRMGGARCWR